MAKHRKKQEQQPPEQPEKTIDLPEAVEEKTIEAPKKGGTVFHKLWQWAIRHKKWSIPVVVVLVLAVLAAIPFTRYAVAGLVMKQDIQVTVIDIQTDKPVSGAKVALAGQTADTDNEGKAKLRVPVGNTELVVAKRYYKDAKQGVTVTIKKPAPIEVQFEATGRQVPVTVVNSITGAPIENATVTAESSDAKTDKNGQATIVLPPNKPEVKGSVLGDKYNKTEVTIKVTAQNDPANIFKITPSGKIYFLSNQSGKIDLVKTNLDGTSRQTVLAGTGKEDKSDTVLLASRDWKYVALKSKRDGGEYPKVFLIETGSDKLTTVDEGDADFTLYGWSNHHLVYTVYRQKVLYHQPKREALKSYDASAKKIIVLTETAASGDQSASVYQGLGSVYVLKNEIVYTMGWSSSWSSYNYNKAVVLMGSKQATIETVRADGSQKKVVRGYNPPDETHRFIDTRTADFGEIYVRYYTKDAVKFDEYADGKIKTIDIPYDDYYNEEYPAYVVSPSGDKTLWLANRDGKNAVFVGNGEGEEGSQIGAEEDYTVYGWFTDDYVLVTRKNSEMRIMSDKGAQGGLTSSLKISDYYKPNYYYRGYGYGYGG